MASRYGWSPDFTRYSVTTFDPGARLVFTHGFRFNPSSTARLATRPAAIITLGFDVFVQLVMAAITTDPCSISMAAASATAAPPSRPVDGAVLIPFFSSGRAAANELFA